MLRDVTSALAQVLRDEIASELDDDEIQITIEPRMVMSPSTGLCLDIYPAAPPRDSEAAGFGDLSGMYVLTVRARANTIDADEVQDILLDMIDDEHALSVAAAVESDQDLDGYATQVVVDADGFSGLLEFASGSVPYVGCTWRVLVGVAVS